MWHKGVMKLKDMILFPVGITPACKFAAERLYEKGIPLVDHPMPEVTHVLLDIPSFLADGMLRGGQDPKDVLERLPPSVTVIGGSLEHPILKGYHTIDLLKDAQYLAQNAAITADCALQVAAPHLTCILAGLPVLILGWGRIGKFLGVMLKNAGAHITIAARKETDRAMIQTLGMRAVDVIDLAQTLPGCRLLFNTVPQILIPEEDLAMCNNCVKIELASKPGLEGTDIIQAKGLPGIYAPESSGNLIAKTILRYLRRDWK